MSVNPDGQARSAGSVGIEGVADSSVGGSVGRGSVGGGPRSAAHDMFDADVASNSLGMRLLEAHEGRAVVTMRVTDAMINGHGLAHGGYLFALADTAFACACNSHGPPTVAAGGDINFIAPARAGDELVAVAEQRVRYGRNGVYDVSVRRGGEHGDVVAEMRGRSRTIRGERPAS